MRVGVLLDGGGDAGVEADEEDKKIGREGVGEGLGDVVVGLRLLFGAFGSGSGKVGVGWGWRG